MTFEYIAMKKINRSRLLFSIFTLGGFWPVFAKPPQTPILCPVLYEMVGEHRLLLRANYDGPTGNLQALGKSSFEPKAVIRSLRSDDGSEGMNNGGVYLIEGPDQQNYVYKLIPQDPYVHRSWGAPALGSADAAQNVDLRQLKKFVEIQKFLADYTGFVPKIRGIRTAEEVLKDIAKFPELGAQLKPKVFHYAIEMDYLPGAWNFSKTKELPNGFTMADLSADKIENAVKAMHGLVEYMSKLRIAPNDVQWVLLPDGRVSLLDLDFYSLWPDGVDLSSINSQNNARQVELLISRWEKETRKTYKGFRP